jgi:DNA-binding phage protein
VFGRAISLGDKERGVRFGVQPKLSDEVVKKIGKPRRTATLTEIMRQTGLSKASVYRALSA